MRVAGGVFDWLLSFVLLVAKNELRKTEPLEKMLQDGRRISERDPGESDFESNGPSVLRGPAGPVLRDLAPGLPAGVRTRVVSGVGLSRQGNNVVFDAIPSACGSKADRFRIGGAQSALRTVPRSVPEVDKKCGFACIRLCTVC